MNQRPESGLIGSPELNWICTSMEWSETKAIGCLVYLWGKSPKSSQVQATGRAIAQWCGSKTDDEAVKLIGALSYQQAGFITPAESPESDCTNILEKRFYVVADERHVKRNKRFLKVNL
jgi:hypothetical protein